MSVNARSRRRGFGARLQEPLKKRGRQPPQRRVVEQRQAQQHRLKVEPIVVAGEKNAAFQKQDAERRDEPQAARAEDEERQTELDEKHGSGRGLQEAGGQLCRIQRQRRRQRLRQKMVVERSEIPPVGIAADQLDDAGHEHEAEQEPAREPDAGDRPQAHHERDNRCLQKERVPLEVHEGLPGVEQRKIERIDENKAETRHEIENQHQRQEGPAPAHGLNCEIAVIQPEHHRRDDESAPP